MPVFGQSVTEKAWSILDSGLADKSTENRTAAVRALGLLRQDARAQTAAEQRLGDSNPLVRGAAATSLAKMEAQSSAPKIEPLLKDPDVNVVLTAADALYQLGDPKAYEVYYAALTSRRKAGMPIAADKLKALKDPKSAAKLGLKQGLGIIPLGAPAMTAVQTITRDDTSPARAAAALRLAHDPDERTKKALVQAMRDDKPLVRVAAASAIAERDDPTLLSDLVARFADDNEIVRLTAAAGAVRLDRRRPSQE